MRLHRFIVDTDFNLSNVVITDKKFVHQLRHVLRLSKGDELVMCDGKNNEAVVRITEIDEKNVKVEVLKRQSNTSESAKHVILYCAVLKRENFELVIQKATEVGVKEIVPIITNRTVKTNFKYERLCDIIKEACEQSGRGIIPILNQPIGFFKIIDQAKKNGVNYFFDIDAPVLRGKDASSVSSSRTPIPALGEARQGRRDVSVDCEILNPVQNDSESSNLKIGLFIGPEGGWDDSERQIAKEAEFLFAGLGKLTLRAETAAIIASYNLVNL